MSFDVNKYREDHESEEHWELRKAFMERWKNDYPEERLICLARVFANMEFMGCRYPPEVMHEVAGLSHEIVKQYRDSKKNKLQRTFVSASTAAEDRAKGVKRAGGIVIDTPAAKSTKIQFVAQGQTLDKDSDDEEVKIVENRNKDVSTDKTTSQVKVVNEYLEEMMKVKCLNVKSFRETMFLTPFGKLVLLVRPWSSKLCIILTSCSVCGINAQSSFENGCFSLTLNGKLLAQATGDTKPEARSIVEMMAWNRLKEEAISVVVKEQWIAQGDAPISVGEVTGRSAAEGSFGTPIESNVAAKMMKLMGWKGGGLGADAQGIAEPIKPNLQMVNRAGLGSENLDLRQLRRAANDLMNRYLASDTLDLDLVFSSEFSKEERAQLHQCAQRAGLASRSYGKEDMDRFLVVRKKLDPFSLARAVIDKGGITPKYQVFIPAGLQKNGR